MKKITVKFVDYDGNMLAIIKKDIDAHFDEEVYTPPIVDIYETKRFSHWSKDIDALKENAIVSAVYETIYPFMFEEIDGKLYLTDTDCRCMNTHFMIPDVYADKKVYGIMPGAFKNVSANAASIYIPKTVKDIKPGAFDSCYNTTLVFENKANKAGFRKDICNFEPRVFFGCNEDNHFISEEYEYIVHGNKAIILRCLENYGATIVTDRVRLGNKLCEVVGIDDYAFYCPACSDFYEIYIPKKFDVENLLIDYITNASLVRY